MLKGPIYLFIISKFSNYPKAFTGTTTILPVKLVLNASIADNTVSLSPTTTIVLGSRISLFKNFFLLNAGICSGTVSSIYSFLTLTENEDKFLKFGPVSGKPVLIS